MTDWNTMVEDIQAAMQAVDAAHAATETLREKADREAIDNFQIKMKELHHRLEQMQKILAHEDEYALDELAHALGAALGNKEMYHRIPHYEEHEKK
jgi:hypothetical protein